MKVLVTLLSLLVAVSARNPQHTSLGRPSSHHIPHEVKISNAINVHGITNPTAGDLGFRDMGKVAEPFVGVPGDVGDPGVLLGEWNTLGVPQGGKLRPPVFEDEEPDEDGTSGSIRSSISSSSSSSSSSGVPQEGMYGPPLMFKPDGVPQGGKLGPPLISEASGVPQGEKFGPPLFEAEEPTDEDGTRSNIHSSINSRSSSTKTTSKQKEVRIPRSPRQSRDNPNPGTVPRYVFVKCKEEGRINSKVSEGLLALPGDGDTDGDSHDGDDEEEEEGKQSVEEKEEEEKGKEQSAKGEEKEGEQSVEGKEEEEEEGKQSAEGEENQEDKQEGGQSAEGDEKEEKQEEQDGGQSVEGEEGGQSVEGEEKEKRKEQQKQEKEEEEKKQQQEQEEEQQEEQLEQRKEESEEEQQQNDVDEQQQQEGEQQDDINEQQQQEEGGQQEDVEEQQQEEEKKKEGGQQEDVDEQQQQQQEEEEKEEEGKQGDDCEQQQQQEGEDGEEGGSVAAAVASFDTALASFMSGGRHDSVERGDLSAAIVHLVNTVITDNLARTAATRRGHARSLANTPPPDDDLDTGTFSQGIRDWVQGMVTSTAFPQDSSHTPSAASSSSEPLRDTLSQRLRTTLVEDQPPPRTGGSEGGLRLGVKVGELIRKTLKKAFQRGGVGGDGGDHLGRREEVSSGRTTMEDIVDEAMTTAGMDRRRRLMHVHPRTLQGALTRSRRSVSPGGARPLSGGARGRTPTKKVNTKHDVPDKKQYGGGVKVGVAGQESGPAGGSGGSGRKATRRPARRRRGAPWQEGQQQQQEEEKVEEEEEEDGVLEEGEELPEPAELAWVNPTQLVQQGAYVENVPSLANLVGLRLFKYEFPQPQAPRIAPPDTQGRRRASINTTLRPAAATTNDVLPPFGDTFHDSFDRYYKKFRKSDAHYFPEVSRATTVGGGSEAFPRRPQHGPPRPVYPSPGAPDSIVQLFNPLNLFGHNQFPQLPRYPAPVPPAGPYNPNSRPRRPLLPPGARNTPTDQEVGGGGVTYEVIANEEAEKNRGYQYKEDYPLRDDLYVGQDGHIYLRDDPSITTPLPNPPSSPPTQHPPTQHQQEDDLFLNEYSTLLQNHNLDSYNYLEEPRDLDDSHDYTHQDYSSDHDYTHQDDYRTPRPTQTHTEGPSYDHWNPSYSSYPRQQRAPYNTYVPQSRPSSSWSLDNGILGWLLGPFRNSALPSYFYSSREVQMPRMRYNAGWPRRFNTRHAPSQQLHVPHAYPSSRQPLTRLIHQPATQEPVYTKPPTLNPPKSIPTETPEAKNKGFYLGNGFFDADFATLFHMSPSQPQETVEELPTPIPATKNTPAPTS